MDTQCAMHHLCPAEPTRTINRHDYCRHHFEMLKRGATGCETCQGEANHMYNNTKLCCAHYMAGVKARKAQPVTG